MLHHPLALQRALRPLKRRVPAPRRKILDEAATADRIARLGAHPDVWLPVLRPAPDRWLHLNLVYDAGPTMPIWRPLVRELHAVLAQSGVFRTVTLHRATPDGRAHGVPVAADGRTVTLVVSDGMGPQWRPGPAGDRWYRTLRRWAHGMPLAVVQPLPELLWHTTALPATPGLLTAPSPAAPTSLLTFTPYAPDTAPGSPSSGALPLPVLEPGPTWLANWSSLVADPGGGRVPGAVAWLDESPVPPSESSAPDIASLPPRDLVLHFRSTASPEAFRLAGHLSLAVPSLPVMRLVQRVLDHQPRPQHLAEVILSGMLTTVPGPPGSYEFRPGVRDLLQRTLPRTARGRTREFLARVGGLIDERAGLAAGEFRAEAGDGGSAFATVSEETVRRLGGGGEEEGVVFGGRYRAAQTGIGGWRAAVDSETGQPVAVFQYLPQAASRERFLREAAALAGLRHPNVLPVIDFGMEGDAPYLVAEELEGLALEDLMTAPPLPFGVFDRLSKQALAGLKALHERGLTVFHERGLVRGQQDVTGLLIRPDGTVVISRFALGDESRGKDAEGEVRALQEFLRTVIRATGTPSSPRTRPTFRMLGPLRIVDDEGQSPTISPNAGALLCMLLLRHGRRVPNAELVQGLWGQPSDPSAAETRLADLHRELRTSLGANVALPTVPNDYVLLAPDAYIDLLECEKLLAARAPEQSPRTQRAAIQRSLDLWYGDPLDGLPGPAAQAARLRLRALRLTLCATRAELDLELGDFAQAAADLTPLVEEHPDRQDFRRLHIVALKGQGRIAEALEAYEAYEEHRQRMYSEPLDAVFQELHRELREAAEQQRPTIVFELPHGGDLGFVLQEAVARLMARIKLPPDQYEILARDNGYVVVPKPHVYFLPALVTAVLQDLPEHLATLEDPPQVRVTFWQSTTPNRPVVPPQIQGILDESWADVTVLVSPALYEEFANSSSVDSGRFQPLWTGAQETPVAWYCPLHLSPSETGTRDLVRGPFTTHHVTGLESPSPGRTAVVLAPSDGPLTLLNPAHPWGKRPPGTMSYYEVDLTIHQAVHPVSLPSSGGGTFAATAEMSWHVDDPVAYLRGEAQNISEVLLAHFLKEAARVTRRYPLNRGGAAQQALRGALRRWPLPGLSVTCSVGLSPEGDPVAAPQARRPPSDAPLATHLRATETVLIGLDGPLTRLFTTKSARAAALELISLAVENRDPEEALQGHPLASAPHTPAHPLEVLRAFATSSVGPTLRRRLDDLELRAVPHTHPTPDAHALIRTLTESGRRVEVVTDVCAQAAQRIMSHHSLPLTGVHGRSDDLGLLMPNPDCLLRALARTGRPSATGLLISSSPAELDAASRLGLRVIAFADIPATARRLRETGHETPLSSLEPLLDAARTL